MQAGVQVAGSSDTRGDPARAAAQRPRRVDVAASYDLGFERYDQLWSPVILPAAVALVPLLEIGDGDVVLDVGTGTGALVPAVRSAAPMASILGVDASHEMLRVALSKRNVPVARGDAMMLPVRAAAVDAAVFAYVLFHLPDPLTALREAHRVLRPGGRVATVTWAWEHAETAQKLWDEALAESGAAPLRLRRSDVGLDSLEAVEELVRSAGFTPARVWAEGLSKQWEPESFFALATGSGPSRQRLAGLDDGARTSLLERFQESLARLRPEDFRWEGEVICAVAVKDGAGDANPSIQVEATSA